MTLCISKHLIFVPKVMLWFKLVLKGKKSTNLVFLFIVLGPIVSCAAATRLERVIINIPIQTTSWELWKHPNPAPGDRPMFFKAESPKESKNGFKTISCCGYRKAIFSNYFFRYQKSSKKLDGITSNWFPHGLNCLKYNIDIVSDIRTT